MASPRARFWLWLPPLAACWADVAATLLGQGRRYWSGDYCQVTEWNPLARELLRLHPLAFVIAAAASCVLVAAAVMVLNWQLAVAIAFIVTFAHTVAAAAWAARSGIWGMVAAVGLLVLCERAVAISWKFAGEFT